MINIVIPMAGRGSRFVEAGYTVPKPLINVMGQSMIELVVNNISPKEEHRFIFVCQVDHLKQYSLEKKLKAIAPNCVIIPIDYITDGAACTVLLAKEYINNDEQLMIANSDQFINFDINEYLNAMKDCDGLIMTMPATGPKWSYVLRDDNGFVKEVREKEQVSFEATTGIYNYAHGRDFVDSAEKMIKDNKRVKNEFYVAPVYNEMIEIGKRIVCFNIGNEMYGLGTPEDLDSFLKSEVAKQNK